MKIYKTLSSLHTLKIMLPLYLTLAIGNDFFTKKTESAVWILMCSMLHSEEWSQVYPYWGENWKMTVNNKNVSRQREYFNVCFILYTMRWVWLLFDNFENIRTNKTDQSQLTVGTWSVLSLLEHQEIHVGITFS